MTDYDGGINDDEQERRDLLEEIRREITYDYDEDEGEDECSE
jgi:hypothetical protein